MVPSATAAAAGIAGVGRPWAWPPALRMALQAFLWLVILCGAVPFAFFYIMTPTRWYQVDAKELIAWRNGLVLQYPFGNGTTGRTTPLLSGTISFLVIWQWAATLAVALPAALLLWLRQGTPEAAAPAAKPAGSGSQGFNLGAAMRRSVRRASRLLSWRVPPRGLWRGLLGPDGLSLLDLLLILLWLGLHVLWMHEMTMRTLDNRRRKPPPPAPKAARPPPLAAAAKAPAATTAANATKAPAGVTSPAAGTKTAASAPAAPAPPPHHRRNLLQNPVAAPSAANSFAAPKPAPSPAPRRPPPPPPKRVVPLPEYVQNNLAKYYGWVGRLDILLLFFPLARCNFLHWLLGSDFPSLIKYHRWLGQGTILMYSLHGIQYMGTWVRDGNLVEMLKWGMTAGVNRQAGLVALAGGWLLWLTSLPVVRRRLFNQVFYPCHIAGALVFMLFGFMHRKDVAPWVMPGVFLYLLDVVLRNLQPLFNATTISAATNADVSADGGCVTLTLPADDSLEWTAADIVFLRVPAVSCWQWHPLTLASSSAPAPGGGKRMVLHIKRYDRWTRRLLARLATQPDTPLAVSVSGPHLAARREWAAAYSRIVLVAGGIGVTPVLGMAAEMVARRRAGLPALGDGADGGGGRASLVWVSRSAAELGVLPAEVAEEAASGGKASWLDVRLFLTGGGGAAGGKGADAVATLGDVKLSMSPKVAGAGTGALIRPLSAPYVHSPLLWAAAALLSFAGGFGGLICSQAFDAHRARNVRFRDDFSYMGMLQFAALGFGAMAPPAALMLAAHTLKAMKLRRTASSLSRSPSDASAAPAPPGLATSASMDSTAGSDSERSSSGGKDRCLAAPAAHASSLAPLITAGRPDLRAILAAAAEEAAGAAGAGAADAAVGVFVAGPAPLVAAVREAAATLNGVWGGRGGGAFLEVHAMTHEL